MNDDDDNDDDDDGWKILKPGVVLFETTIGSLDKPIPHPVLDDPEKMMRIIANPLYDKLTFSRAAHIKSPTSPRCGRSSRQLNRSIEQTTVIPLKSKDFKQTTTKSLANGSEVNCSRPQSKRHISPPFRLPKSAASTRKPSQTIPSRAPSRTIPSRSSTRSNTALSNNQSIQSALINTTSNTKKSLTDGTIRYVDSHHGFEVQRYSASNWLTTEVFTKDICQSHEQTFRQMLDKKRQYERLSRSIYSSDYYNKRWHELVESYKHGYLTHTEWAKQNYQLLCLRTLYKQAKQREQRDVNLDAQDVRRERARSAYQEWKESKNEDNSKPSHSRVNTAHSQPTVEGASFLSNNSFSTPISIAIDENNTTLADTSIPLSLSTLDSETQKTSIYQPAIISKNPSATEKALYMLDEQRWSLQAMLKRVVGLAEPLPPPPKIIHRKQSPMTNTSVDSGFESVP